MKQKAIKQNFGINLKVLALTLTAALVMLISSGGFISVMAIEETVELEWDKPGSIRLNKTATATDNDNEWRIDLTVEGKNYPTATDVVLVIDTSTSMNKSMSGGQTLYGEKSRLDYTKIAAEDFVDNIITESTESTHRMAIVTFAQQSSQKCSFTNDKTNLKKYISNLSANGGTNMQAGLNKAKTMLESSDAQNKIIVILGDGRPTYCNEITSATGISVNHQTSDNKTSHTVVFSDSYTMVFDYSEAVGDGSSSEYRSLYSVYCNECNKNVSLSGSLSVPTEYEAKQIKNDGIKIYSIAFGADTEGENVLKNISSNTSNNTSFYTQIPANTSTDNVQTLLNSTFENIAANILSAASDGIVTDPMGEMFDIVAPNGADDITISIINSSDNSVEKTFKGSENNTVTIISGNTLKWNVGTVPDGKILKMSYYVRIKDTAVSGVEYPTNKETYFEYKNYLNNDAVKKFPVPTASIATGKINICCYLSDSKGNPLNKNGQAVTDISDAYILKNYDYMINNNTKLSLGKTYTITADTIPNTVFVGSHTENSALTDSTTAAIELTKQSCEQTVYFAYTMNNGTLTIVKSGDLQDNESSLFKIESSDGSVFYETIQGSGSRTVKNLTVGSKYTVTELTDWSWKYQLNGDNPQSIYIGVDGGTANFENKSKPTQWLSDESIVSNKFVENEVS